MGCAIEHKCKENSNYIYKLISAVLKNKKLSKLFREWSVSGPLSNQFWIQFVDGKFNLNI